MEKSNNSRFLDLDTTEGNRLINFVRSNLIIKVEVDDNHELKLRLSIDQAYTTQALGEFLKNTISKRDHLLNNETLSRVTIPPIEYIRQKSLDLKDLTPAEIEILEQMCKGDCPKIVAVKLNKPYQTVKSHLKSIYKKLRVRTDIAATIEYLKLKGVCLEPFADERMLIA